MTSAAFPCGPLCPLWFKVLIFTTEDTGVTEESITLL